MVNHKAEQEKLDIKKLVQKTHQTGHPSRFESGH